jgi:hypothetical protein
VKATTFLVASHRGNLTGRRVVLRIKMPSFCASRLVTKKGNSPLLFTAKHEFHPPALLALRSCLSNLAIFPILAVSFLASPSFLPSFLSFFPFLPPHSYLPGHCTSPEQSKIVPTTAARSEFPLLARSLPPKRATSESEKEIGMTLDK